MVEHSRKYIIYYKFCGAGKSTVAEGAIDDFFPGFWVNNNFEFTRKSDNVFYIPSSQIQYISPVMAEITEDGLVEYGRQ